MVDPYEALLKKAYRSITEPSGESERFSIPEPRVFIEGKTTVLENFAEIASTLRREPDHLMKFLLGELGTAGKIEGNRAIFNGKFEREMLNNAIKSYTEDYVICSECGRPDTRLVKDGRILLLRCDACGGHRPVKKRKARTEPAGNKLEEGAEIDVKIEFLSKRGDGVVKIGKYTLYVPNVRVGEQLRVRINRIAGTIGFTEKVP
jgi:translation initiation factor 2 subunit 2